MRNVSKRRTLYTDQQRENHKKLMLECFSIRNNKNGKIVFSPEQKASACIGIDMGMSTREISKIINVSTSAIYGWDQQRRVIQSTNSIQKIKVLPVERASTLHIKSVKSKMPIFSLQIWKLNIELFTIWRI
jgi:hypothetical protein